MSSTFNKKTADINSATYLKIDQLEDFDINNSYDIELANFFMNSIKN